MKRRVVVLLMAAVVIGACVGTMTLRRASSGKRGGESRFTDKLLLPATPVKDQGNSDFCWVYSMLATVETDLIVAGDSLNLSPCYVVRAVLKDRARRHFLSNGEQHIDMRGTPMELLRTIERDGVMTYDAYHSDAKDVREIARQLEHISVMSKSISEEEHATDNALDRFMGPLPLNIWLFGAQYTPQELSRSVCRSSQYKAFTSYTHCPANEMVNLSLPDDHIGTSFMNLELDSLMCLIDKSLRSGHAVCWMGATNNECFSFKKGVAKLADDIVVTAADRQRAAETRRAKDDHSMEIVGMASDQDGRRYFIAKNSWGKDNPYGGYMYLSEGYMRLYTVAVIMRTQ